MNQVGSHVVLGPCTIPGADCFYDDQLAIYTAHDLRGCVPVCGGCARWRAGQSLQPGHMDGCNPDDAAPEVAESRRRRPLEGGR